MKGRRRFMAAAVAAALIAGVAAGVTAGAAESAAESAAAESAAAESTAAESAAENAAESAAASGSVRIFTGFSGQHYRPEDGDRYIAECEYPLAAMDEVTAAAYPALAEAFSGFNEEKKAAALDHYADLVRAAEERLAEYPEDELLYTDSERYHVVRADEHLVSLLGVRRGFAGGAHGYETYSGVTFDTESGERLRLGDLVTGGDSFKSLVKEELLRLFPEMEADLTEQYFPETGLDELVWTAGCDGITCYFEAGTLGAYAVGARTVVIPYEGHETLFSENVLDAPENYGVEFSAGMPVRFGGREITVSGELFENGTYHGVSVYIDGKRAGGADDIDTYSVDPAFIRANGREYLYLQYGQGNDYRTLDIYRLGESAERVGTVELARAEEWFENLSFSGRAAMSDPEQLLLRESLRDPVRGDVRHLCRVGEDGLPEEIG